MKTTLSLLATALGLAGITSQARANQTPPTMHNGMVAIDDAELAQMRGRWTPPSGTSNTVAYFGVTMTSNWVATSGQQLNSSMTMGMSFNATGQVQVTFQPTVTIVQTAPTVTVTGSTTPVNRSVDSSGLNNVSGLVQGVQIAGDSNVADNVTSLTVSTEGASTVTPPTGTTYTGQAQTYSAQDGNAMASASISNQGLQVSVSITGQGQVQQWINGGSLGQVIALGADGQSVHNTLQIQLVQRSLTDSVNLSRDLAQAYNQVRGIGLNF